VNASELTSREAVLQAIAEHDQIGQAAFLETYGFDPSHIYLVVHAGRRYDSKALAGAALAHQYGSRDNIRDGLHGGLSGVVPVLRRLGFTVIDVREETDSTGIPPALRDAWEKGDWRQSRDERIAALPPLREMLDRFLRAETGLIEFAKESQDLSFSHPYWGFKGFAQMQLNQYAKVALAADLVDEAERTLRAALPAPADEDQARAALREVVELTQRFVDEADRLGLGKPAPGRVPLIVSYFWEAQNREQWPIAYRASKEVLAAHGLFRESGDPADSYLALRSSILELCHGLGGDVWEIEALLWWLRPKKASVASPKAPQPAVARSSTPTPGTLPDVYVAYRDQGLIFTDEIITSFLLSLWTKPFVILTGISGTGKTRIAQALAHALEPGRTDATSPPVLEPGDEQHASFRITDWTLKSGRLYLGVDQLPKKRWIQA
jgi:hypothetical protein